MTLAHGDVNILDKESKVLTLTIYITCAKEQLDSECVQRKITNRTIWVRNYLLQEGFMETTVGWDVAVAVIAKAPKDGE